MKPVAVLCFAVSLIVASASAPSGAAPARTRTGSDWPTFLGPGGDGVSKETGIRTDWSRGIPIAWQTELGEGYSMGSVAGGRVFLFDRVGSEARLTARDAGTGVLRWTVTHPSEYEDLYGYSAGPRASPVVDGDRVYTFGVEGRLRCHRARDGGLVWEVDTTARFGVVQNFFGVGCTPVVEGDLIIAMVGGSWRA
jgi:outer membrane protein assembly factor BamB